MLETEQHQIVTLANDIGAIVHKDVTVTDIHVENWNYRGVCVINNKPVKVEASFCRVNHWYGSL